MPFLVDGHNLIGQMKGLSLSDPHDEEKLTAILHALAERLHKRITVVFDPNPFDTTPPIGHGRSQHGALTVIYAQPGHQADDIIRTLVGEVRDKQGLTVITSDAAVADFTRRCGVRVQSSRDFIRWMDGLNSRGRQENTKPLSDTREVVNWADVFKEPTPDPQEYRPKVKTIEKKGKRRSDQLKAQVKNIKPLF